MAIAQNDKVLASDYIALKAKVVAELKRRGISYTDTNVSTGAKTLIAQANNLINPTNTINGTVVIPVSQGQKLSASNLSTLDSKITEYSQNTLGGCGSGCMGLCTDACSNACSVGCGNNCTGTCTNNCQGCGTYCTHGCTDGNCFGGCSNSCAMACGSRCSGTCTAFCTLQTRSGPQ